MAFSELQIALIGAGATAVAVVWAYNAWQERMQRKKAEAMLRSDQSDALLDGAASSATTDRVEPHLRDAPAEQTEAEAMPEITPEIVAASGNAQPSTASSAVDAAKVLAPVGALPTQWADPMLDCVLRFQTPDRISASTVWDTQMSWAPLISHPLSWLARESHDAEWKLIEAGHAGEYVEWAAALQLANRRGAVSDGDMARFLNGVTQMAQQMGTLPLEQPLRGDTMLRAAALDEFCAGVDIQFSLHVVEASGGVFAGSKLRGVAEASGLVLGSDGRFHARDTGGNELFSLSSMGAERLDPETIKSLAVSGLTLTLDVPRCTDGAAAFDQMLVTARQLTRTLGGVLVDAQRVALAETMINVIRAKIIELQQRLRDAGIEPGDTRALRLFA